MMREESFIKDRQSRASKGRSAASSAFKSHHNYSRLHRGKQTVPMGGGNVESQGEKLELNKPEMKINFCSMEKKRLEPTSHIQGYLCKLLLVYLRLTGWVLPQC